MGTESKHKFCKKYLEELGLPSDDEQVELLVFDAECAQIRHFWCSVLNHDMNRKIRNREYNLDLYKAYEKFESIARNDKKLIKEIAQNGFFKVADQIDFVKEAKKRAAS